MSLDFFKNQLIVDSSHRKNWLKTNNVETINIEDIKNQIHDNHMHTRIRLLLINTLLYECLVVWRRFNITQFKIHDKKSQRYLFYTTLSLLTLRKENTSYTKRSFVSWFDLYWSMITFVNILETSLLFIQITNLWHDFCVQTLKKIFMITEQINYED
jgi:hypothetical protein